MHRNAYKGRKFGREKDQKRALIKGLAESLFIYESIETTLAKAKELVPYAEKLITKAKKGDLHNRRQIIASLSTKSTAFKLVDEIVPKLKNGLGGNIRVETTRLRTGDNAQLAKVSLILEDKPIRGVKPKVEAESKPKVEKAAK